MDKLLLTEKQITQIADRKFIRVRRNGQSITVGPKTKDDLKSKLRLKIAQLKAELKELG